MVDTTYYKQANENVDQYNQRIASYNASKPPAPITPDALSSTSTPYQTPPNPGDFTSNYTSALTSLDSMFATAPTQTEADNNSLQGMLKDLYSGIDSMGGIVDQNGQIDTTGALNQKKDSAAQQLGYNNYSDVSNQLQDVNNQIQALQKEALAIPLQMQQDAAGRGITKAGLEPIQADALRKNTIKALGLAAISQTLQGNLSRVEDIANKAVEKEFLPLRAKLSFVSKLYDMNKDQLAREDSKKAQLFQAKINERTRVLNNAEEDKKSAILMASAAAKNFPNDPQAQAAMQKAVALDPLDPAYMSKVYSLLAPYQKDPEALKTAMLDQEYKREQIKNAIADRGLTLAQIDKLAADTGKTQAEVAQAMTTANQEQASVVAIVNDILSSDKLRFVGGLQGYNPIARVSPETAPLRNQLNQLTALLALENRGKLKGSGAVSDYESKTLDRSASSLGVKDGFSNLKEEDLRRELKKVKGVLTLMSGLPTNVKIINPQTGQSKYGPADRATVNDAALQGFLIEYQ